MRQRTIAWVEETVQLKDYGRARQITLFEHGRRACPGRPAHSLSSCGKLEQFHDADIRPLNLAVMIHQEYWVEKYQQVLFCADSFEHLAAFMTRVLMRGRVPILIFARLVLFTQRGELPGGRTEFI
jgi:hypothetical protein